MTKLLFFTAATLFKPFHNRYTLQEVYIMHILRNSYECCRYSTASRMWLSGEYNMTQSQVLYLLQDFTPRATIIYIIIQLYSAYRVLYGRAWTTIYFTLFILVIIWMNILNCLKKHVFKNVECIQHCFCKLHSVGKKWYVRT